ncbi:MAG: hypothetical protein H8K03_20475 [Nitrospira sp.]
MSPAPTLVADAPKSLKEAVGAPLAEFFTRPHAWGFLAVIILYKLGDAFASTLQTAFLIGGLGFSATDVGAVRVLWARFSLRSARPPGILRLAPLPEPVGGRKIGRQVELDSRAYAGMHGYS